MMQKSQKKKGENCDKKYKIADSVIWRSEKFNQAYLRVIVNSTLVKIPVSWNVSLRPYHKKLKLLLKKAIWVKVQ